MPPDNQSATSIPPPQPSKDRTGSRASLANPSLQDGPSAPMQPSQADDADLTVFSDLTEPPANPDQTEVKGLTGDIQGGLSGLYNKFRASIASSKEMETVPMSITSDTFVSDRPGTTTNTTSGKTSRVSSPRVAAFDHNNRSDVSVSKLPAKPARLALPSSGLRSPTGTPSSSNIADPALTSVTIHAAVNARSHSRTASLQGAEEAFSLDRSALSPTEEQNLRKVLSRMDQEAKAASARQERQLPPLAKIDTRNIRHSRGTSENVEKDSRQKDVGRSYPTPLSATEDNPLARSDSNQQDSSTAYRSPTIMVESLDNQDALQRIQGSARQDVLSPTARSRKSAPKLIDRVSHSKLPGFQASRASSTDSARTSGTFATGKDSRAFANDKQREEHYEARSVRSSSKLRSRLLKKEFWMKDENARDCFRCGEVFTTFRRKHHCRTCGQIFDNKCTALVSGVYFDMPGAVRVCRPCEVIITSHEDDSSDYSDDMTPADLSARPRTPDRSQARYDDDNVSIASQSLENIARTPVMNLPVRRAFDKGNRTSAVLEFDAPEPSLPRPSSSRSLRTAHAMGHGHKRHHSKHSHIRNLKLYHEDKVPFQRQTQEDPDEQKTSAFHRDSIIDPELAQYLSDDASSDEEPSLRPSHSMEKLPRPGPDTDRTTISGLLAAVRKGRTRMGDRSIASFLNFTNRDADDAASIVSARAIDGPKASRKRNLSVASSVHTKMTPRTTRERLQLVLPPDVDSEKPASPAFRNNRMIRSASMHGLGAPSLELNRASIQHVHKMLRQLLKDKGIAKVSSWQDALIPILLRATDDVDPDLYSGDDPDIRNYVKLKKIPGGKPADTSYTSGYIFSKNVALKSMQRAIVRPRILIITFPLEYARSEAHFMSLDPVIRQEREYLENLVSRIAALKPDILLAQRNISGLALELLDRANITVIYKVKPSVLEAVSRCTYARFHNSVDKLATPADELGTCELFEVKTYLIEGRRKTYIYLSGCPPELGCTIALRGASRDVLKKIKLITDFMIYVVYNLKLETCLMRDEWALIPTSDDLPRTSSASTSSNPIKQAGAPKEVVAGVSTQQQTHSDQASKENPIESQKAAPPEVKRLSTNDSSEIPEDIPVPTFYQDLADKHETRILSASPFVKFPQPYLLQRAREYERRVAWLRKLRDQDLSDSVSVEERSKAQKFTLITAEMVHRPLEGASRKVREIVHAVHDAEYDKALYHYEAQKKSWEAHLANNESLFDPATHQEIVVLFSLVSTVTHVPCQGPDQMAFTFYYDREDQGSPFVADCTLGQYVEDLTLRAEQMCQEESCGKQLHDHHRQYVHGEAVVTVFTERYPAKLRGLQDVILMWSTCKICGIETTVTPMSPSTYKYSFGKYLELSFWSADLHARAGICPHDLHRDHLRYFGYKGWALRVHYDPIDLLEIVVPRMRVTWKVDNDLLFRNEVFAKLEQRITKFMVSVKLRLKSINAEALLSESADSCRSEVERLTKQANEDHTILVKRLQELYTNSRHWEIIPLNLAMRALQEKVADWDQAFTEFEKNYFPSEKDIRRLATLQLKKIFLDRDVSVTSLTSTEEESPQSTELMDEKVPDSPEATRKLSPEKTQSVLQSVMEEHIGGSPEAENADTATASVTPPVQSAIAADDVQRGSVDLEHLDLAVPESVPKTNPVAIVPPSETSPKLFSSREALQQVSRERSDSSEDADGQVVMGKSQTPAIEINKSAIAAKSQLPTPSHPSSRRDTINGPHSPILVRAQSQPTGSVPQRKDFAGPKQSTMSAVSALNGFGSINDRKPLDPQSETSDKRLSERLGFSHLKSSKLVKGQSLIPRATNHKKESRVSSLAKHFEQLTREFEQARLKERRQRAAKNRQSQFYPTFAPKPTVEVYKSVNDAVDEVDESEETLDYPENKAVEAAQPMAQAMAETNEAQVVGDRVDHEGATDTATETEATENEAEVHRSSRAPSEADDKTDIEDEDIDDIHLPDSPEDLLRLSQEDVELKDLPKHERNSLMKMLTNFWAERSSSGWTSLDYPLSASDHIFADCEIIVREDELSSIIAFALDSSDYKRMLNNISGHSSEKQSVAASFESMPILDEDTISHSLLRNTGTHLKYLFGDGPAKMLCKVFFAEQFDAMRKKCGVADRFIESLSRCMKFDSRGGKSKSLFLKTLDDRFVLKSLSPVETQSFLKFAPNYFQIMSEAFFHDLPSVIAKMLGFYQIIVKNPNTGVEHNWFLLVMENLFYDRAPTRIFDLKGSMRNRKINATGERNEVLLDENMVDYIYESPLFAREHSKKLLKSSVHNDTLFLQKQNVMDYSLMIAIDSARKELVVGIIDCIRTYTWDKKLESWIKDRGFISAVMGASGVTGAGVSGGKNRPTVTSPKEYKRRFREAMTRYVLEAPNCWTRVETEEEKERKRKKAVKERGEEYKDSVTGEIRELQPES